MKYATRYGMMSVLTGVLILALCHTGSALTLAKMSLETLTTSSTLVVSGTITDMESQWRDAKHDAIYTFLTLEVNDYIKGEGESTVQVRQMGGQIGDLRQEVPGAPLFEVGDEVVFFLVPFEGTYVIHSIAMGSFRVFSDAERNKVVVSDTGDAHIVDKETMAEAELEDDFLLRDFDAFKAQVQSYVTENDR